MRPELRPCACGCGLTFRPKQSNYVSAPGHKRRKAEHYTPAEKAMRRVLFATMPNGAPCPWCGQPMTNAQRRTGQLISGHIIDRARGGANSGLRYEHASCGKRAGAILGQHLRTNGRRTPAW